MVTRATANRLGFAGALVAGGLAGCLSTPSNDYLFACGIGGSCPAGSGCGGDQLCHPVYVAGAGPADAGSYLCASVSPQCPPGQACGSGNVCTAVDGGTPDAGDAGGTPDAGDAGGAPDAGDAGGGPDAGDAGMPTCNLATAFSGPNAYNCGGECSGLAVADFNHDGYNDVALAVADSSSPKGGVSLVLNTGDGSGTLDAPILSLNLFPCGGDISNPSDYSTPDALAVGDFNGDGWPDLGLSISQASTLGIALNGQDGGFVFGTPQPAASPGCTYDLDGYLYSGIVAYRPQGSAWYLAAVGYGIMDSDGDSVVAASQVQSNPLNLGPWSTLFPASTFTPYGLAIEPLGTSSQPSLALAESDGSGDDEVEVYSSTNQSPGFAATPSSTLVSQGGTTNVSIADLNGDGLNDIVAVNVADNTLSVFYAKPGGYNTAVTFSTVFGDAGIAPVAAAIADLDGDGRADIATVNDQGSVTLMRGLPDGGFLAVAGLTSNLSIPAWIAAADLEDRNARDGGIPDLVIASQFPGAASVEIFKNGCR